MFDEKPTWWEMMKVKIRIGKPFAPVHNIGPIDAHTVIRFKDYYVGLMEKDGEIVNFGWSKNPHMFPDVNISDFWSSVPPHKVNKKEE